MKRRKAREYAVQVLYFMEMNQTEPEEAVQAVIRTNEEEETETAGAPVADKDIDFILQLVKGTRSRIEEIDGLVASHLTGWRFDRLSRVDRQILRLAAFEMVYTRDTPPKAVINEAIELAKYFGTEQSGKFINGVLGKMIQHLDALKEKTNERDNR